MAALDRYNWAVAADTPKRIQALLTEYAARTVQAEASDANKRVDRKTLALSVLANAQPYLLPFTLAVAAVPAIDVAITANPATPAVTDAMITTALGQVWDSFAFIKG